MNNDYGQQFMQNLNAQPVQPSSNEPNNSKMPIIIIAVLAAIIFVESIILVIMATNNSSLISKINTEETTEEEDTEEEEVVDNTESDYIFDEEDNLTAINLECKSEDGSNFTLSTNNSYKFYNASTQSATSGTYTITRDSIIQLSNSNKTIFYDGTIIADGNIIYECEEDLDETATENE